MLDLKIDVMESKKDYNKKNIVERYISLAKDVGLWKSEEYVFNRFVPKNSKILDIGCGAGRTTIDLYEKGWTDIEGIDTSKKLIDAAKAISKQKSDLISFYVDDALALDAGNETFDVVFFSYNGLMTIPEFKNRLFAVSEIARVLKPDGLFIFTTHDRDDNKDYKNWWKEEKNRFENGLCDKRIIEFGDRIIQEAGEELFVHIPNTKEVYALLNECGFDCIWTKMRWDICATPKKEKELFGECRFYVAKKRV